MDRPRSINKEIARILSITPETVKTHVKHIFNKLDVDKRAQPFRVRKVWAS